MKVEITTAKSESFYRCGIQFTKEPKTLEVGKDKDITKEQLEILEKETMLVVRCPEEERANIKDTIMEEVYEEIKTEVIQDVKSGKIKIDGVEVKKPKRTRTSEKTIKDEKEKDK